MIYPITFGNAKSCCFLRTPAQGTFLLLWSALGYHFLGLMYAIFLLDSHTILWSVVFYALVVAVCVPGLLRLTSNTTNTSFLLPFLAYRVLVIIIDLLMIYSIRHNLMGALAFAVDLLADLHFVDVVFTCYRRLRRGTPIKYSSLPLNDGGNIGVTSNHDYPFTA